MQVSIIVVCYNERRNIVGCLESLAGMDYAKGDYEIICVDNLSTDGTREAIQDIITNHQNVRMIVNPMQNIPRSRNLGIKEARFPFIAFTDADCIVSADWLSKLVNGYERNRQSAPMLAAVGGTNIAPLGRARFYDASNITMKTLLGNRDSTQGKEFGADVEVDHMPTLNILYAKRAIEEVGYFDESFCSVCEDPDLNYRLIKAGYKIFYINNAAVTHAFRPGFRVWAKRIFRYGWGRIQLLSKHPDRLSVAYFAPPIIVLLSLSSVLAPLSLVSIWPLATYVFIILLYSAFHCARSRRLDLLLHVAFLYLVTHYAFGLGEIWGLVGRCKAAESTSGD